MAEITIRTKQERVEGAWLDAAAGITLTGLSSLSEYSGDFFSGQTLLVIEETNTVFEVIYNGVSTDSKSGWQIKTMPIADYASAITAAISDAYASCSITGRRPKYSKLVKLGSEIRVAHDDLSDPSSEFYNKPATYFVSAIDGVSLTWARKNEGGGGAIYWEGDPDATPTYPD